MMVRWICPAIVSVCQDFPVKLSDEDDSQNRGSECQYGLEIEKDVRAVEIMMRTIYVLKTADFFTDVSAAEQFLCGAKRKMYQADLTETEWRI